MALEERAESKMKPVKAQSMKPPSGAWSDRWRSVRHLGKGGQSFTFLVESLHDTDSKGVLKVLRDSKEQAVLRMGVEVASLVLLSAVEARVPRVLETKDPQLPGCHYLVIEYIPGQTLQEFVDAVSRIALEEAIRIVEEIVEVIEVGHANGVLHRDLKPDNVLIESESNRTVVLDYGLSFNSENDESITQSGETFRNKFLDLPENTTPGGSRRDPRSDLTAAVAILYFVLSGKQPGQLIGQDGKPPHRRAGCGLDKCECSPTQRRDLEAILDRGFQPNIEDRFQTMAELKLRLSSLLALPQKKQNPVSLAQAYSDELRRNDKATIIESIQPGAKLLFEGVVERSALYVGPVLGQFNVTMNYREGGVQLPSGVSRVLYTPEIVVGVRNHPHIVAWQYVVGLRGKEVVVFRAKSPQKHALELGPLVEEVFVYGIQEVPPIERFQEEIDHAISNSMGQIMDVIRNPEL